MLLRNTKRFFIVYIIKKYSFGSSKKALKARLKFLWLLFLKKPFFFLTSMQDDTFSPFVFWTRLCSEVTGFFFFFQGEQTDVPPGMALVGDLLSHQDATKLLHCQYLSEPTAVVMDTMRNVQLIKLQINKSQNHWSLCRKTDIRIFMLALMPITNSAICHYSRDIKGRV